MEEIATVTTEIEEVTKIGPVTKIVLATKTDKANKIDQATKRDQATKIDQAIKIDQVIKTDQATMIDHLPTKIDRITKTDLATRIEVTTVIEEATKIVEVIVNEVETKIEVEREVTVATMTGTIAVVMVEEMVAAIPEPTGPWDPKAEAEKDPNWARIYVSNLPDDITVDELQGIFGGLGVIAKEKQKRGYKDQWPWKIKIYTNDDGTSKGDAVITYEDANAARTAPGFFNGSDIRGKTITVELAGKPEPPVGGWTGGQGGRGGRGSGGRGYGGGRGGGRGDSRYRPY
ncbi:RNA-binding protein EWS [Aphanomyces cochlioides]|nr:RNA-binding protein EWS [Aphanomyces cochlioides]